MPRKKSDGDYGASQIKVLKGLEAVRQRPAMYVGSTDIHGLHHIFYEVLDNGVDEAMANRANKISITIEKDGSMVVEDNGAGIPVDKHPETKKSTVETVMTVLHAGGKFEKGAYKVSSGLHGVGVSCTNALSEKMITTVYHEGKVYQQEYKRGLPQTDLKVVGDCPKSKTGTRQQFWPDSQIFSTTQFDRQVILAKIKNQAYLTSQTRFIFTDHSGEKKFTQAYYYTNGMKAFVRSLLVGKDLLAETFYGQGNYKDVDVEVALTYCDDSKEHVKVFGNTVHNVEGGTHLAGFRAALTQTINKFAVEQKLMKENESVLGDDVREGLCAVVSVKLSDPQFEGQTKVKLNNPEVRTAVQKVTSDLLLSFLLEHPKDAKTVVEKALLASKARRAAKAARKAIMRKSALSLGGLPGKLTDCSTRDRSKTELFIVEGDSAAGSAKLARDREIQAVLVMGGKPRNAEKSHLDQVLKNEKIKDMVTALGAGVDKDIKLDKLRYGKIIIMTDADVDGMHIVTLLLTFLYNYMQELLENGRIYIAQPPLFKVEIGKEKYWLLNEEEKNKFVKSVQAKNKKAEVFRFKGLGEMNPDQLWETTMDPETRVLKQVSIQDAEEAAKIFDLLMGSEVPPRRRFIQQHAQFALLDV